MDATTRSGIGAAAALALLGGACASAPSGAPGGAMAREAAFGDALEVADAERTFRASLSLPFELKTGGDGVHAIEIPLEDSVTIGCVIWPDGSELGATAERRAQRIYEELGAQGFEVSDRHLVDLGAGEIDGSPYQSIASTFRISNDTIAAAGLMKVAAANRQGFGIGCSHWDLGYVETFRRAFDELVRSFRAADPGPAPYYVEVSTVRLGEVVVGVTRQTLTRDADGDVRAVSESSHVLPRSASVWVVSYQVDVDWSQANGHLINAYTSDTGVDGPRTQLELRANEEGGWHVRGTYQEKPLDVALEHEGVIHSALAELLAMTRALVPHGDRSRLTLARWIAGADPTRVIEAEFEVDADDPRWLSARMGPLEGRARRDAAGLPERTTVDVGGHEMTIERVYQHGEP